MSLAWGKMKVDSSFSLVVDKIRLGKSRRGGLSWRPLYQLGLYWCAWAEEQVLDKVPGFSLPMVSLILS